MKNNKDNNNILTLIFDKSKILKCKYCVISC